MKIKVYSLPEAEQIIEDVRGNWISIRDRGYDELYKKIDENADDCLVLYFDDVDNYRVRNNLIHPFYVKQFMTREPIYFDEQMASDIYGWALGKKEINIHCFAGVSRSQAVGHVLNIFFNCLEGNERDFFNSIPKFTMMNPHVVNIMMNVFKERTNG